MKINKISEQLHKPLKQLKYVAYVRKSTEESDRQKLSIEAQIDEIIKQFPDKDIKFIRESHSAAKSGVRPEFQKMIEGFNKGKYQGLIAWHPDRLARNIQDSATVISLLKAGAIQDLKFCNFTFEDTPEGIMMLQMIMSQAEYFSAKLSKDVKRGNAKKRSIGGTTGLAPIGYINCGRGSIIQPDPERFEDVKRAFQLMLTGNYSVTKIQYIMNEEWGFKTIKRKKTGGKPVAIQTLYTMFRNPLYAGVIVDPHTGELLPAAHQAIITPDEYDRIQDLLGRQGMPRLTKRDKVFPLRGFLTCGQCGCAITAEEKTKKLKNGKELHYRYYRCTHKRGNCRQGSIQEQLLQKQIDDLLDQYEITPELYKLGVKALKEVASREIDARNSAQVVQHQSIKVIQERLDNLLDLVTTGVITPIDYQKKTKELKARLNELQRDQTATAERAKNWYEIVESTLLLITSARDGFSKGTLEDKRRILMTIGSDPILTDKQLGIKEHFWLVPIKENKPTLTEMYQKVRTSPQQMKNASEEAIIQFWCG